jgi:molybdopterin-guanine dinucleotide biosynthesis protein A
VKPGRDQISGLVLAGGRGSRMGGVDKGLQLLLGRTLVEVVVNRLQPQVAALMISANRHLDAYAALGFPVLTDSDPGHAGPLAGIAAGLSVCPTPWLAVVPCDSPRLPMDLVARLAAALADAATPGAIAVTPAPGGGLRRQPVFCLLQRQLAPGLRACLARGQRGVEAWTREAGLALALFEDEGAFFNANTAADLLLLQGR